MKPWHWTVLGIAGVAVFTVLVVLGVSLRPERTTYRCENITSSIFTCTRR